MKLTPAQVKNLMRRGLRFLVDPEPERAEKDRMIAFFEHSCAYCGVQIPVGDGDIDHLVSSAKGGRNHISNRAYSCKRCNAEEKREADWQEFLVQKYGNTAIMELRRSKIRQWIESEGAVPPLSDATFRTVEEQGRKVTEAYDEACRQVRNA